MGLFVSSGSFGFEALHGAAFLHETESLPSFSKEAELEQSYTNAELVVFSGDEMRQN